MDGGLHPPLPPTGAALLDTACFWIEDSSWNRFALISILAKNPNIFIFRVMVKKHKNTEAGNS